jgi:DNA-binding NtrC family response regulator
MPAQSDIPPAPWVLLISADAARRVTLRAQLDGAGYQVLEARGTAEALHALRRSSRPLTVLLDAPMLPLLNAILPDRRAARHHAYLLLCDQDGTCHPRARALLEQLSLDVLPASGETTSLIAAIARAGRRLSPAPLYA